MATLVATSPPSPQVVKVVASLRLLVAAACLLVAWPPIDRSVFPCSVFPVLLSVEHTAVELEHNMCSNKYCRAYLAPIAKSTGIRFAIIFITIY